MGVEINPQTKNISPVAKLVKKAAPKATFIQKVIKGDTYLVLSQSQQFPEDEFQGLYYTNIASSFVFIPPPFEPKYLAQLVTQNNTLAQCIEAMEVNIDGTGHELEPVDPDEDPDQDEVDRINGFFAEPYPNQSFVSIRRKLRTELESIGWSAIEVLRNAAGEMVGLRNVPGYLLRWIRLDEPVKVKKTVIRNGVEVVLEFMDRERRYATRVGTNSYTFYRDFGTTRQIHRTAGTWESETNQIDPKDRGSEILVFTVWQDVSTPYGIPRWINQLPSVLGSRKAEEASLEFLDAGGMPPAIFFVEGGTLASDMSEQLKQFLSGHMKTKARGVVVEAQSSSGSLDSSGKVSVKTERFGHDAAKDSMYVNYDKQTEEHVRVGFRLPPLFIGKAQDYNFATAQVGYMVAEAQVFQPERNEFDEVINKTVMKELGAKTVKYKSKPITLKDAEAQIKLVTLAKGMTVGEEWIDEVNKISGLNMSFNQTAQMDENGTPLVMPKDPSTNPIGDTSIGAGASASAPVSDVQKPAQGTKGGEEVAVADKPSGKITKASKLAYEFCVAEGFIASKFEPSKSQKATIRKSIDKLPKPQLQLVNRFVEMHVQQAMERGELGLAAAA